MAHIVFKPYKNGLGGLRLVKEKLLQLGANVRELKVVGSNYRIKQRDTVITWGTPKTKIQQFQAFIDHGVPTVGWTTEKHWAAEAIGNGEKILCRTILNGHGGAGITVARTVEELIDAPLYVLYQPKKREFRVHALAGYHGVYIREKKAVAKENRNENFNNLIRNHDNGWVFCKFVDDDEAFDTTQLFLECRAAVSSLGLPFGAVDVGWHPDTGFTVYEVNTAPGCDNKTADFYAHAFLGLDWNDN